MNVLETLRVFRELIEPSMTPTQQEKLRSQKALGLEFEAQRIRRTAERQLRAYCDGDIDAYLDPIDGDRIVMTPNERSRVGKRDRAELKTFFDSVKRRAEVQIEEIVTDGEWAYERGHGRGTLVPNNAPPGVDPAISYRYKYLRIWRKVSSDWKVVRMIWNSEDIPEWPDRVPI